MKVLFDTSVLVAALVKSHPRHGGAFSWYLKGRRGELKMVVATHGLAETYASLTTYPSRPRISPQSATVLIRESIVRVAEIVPLSGQDYLTAMTEVASLGRCGGSIYDALHVIAARKSDSDIVLSFNRKHFEPLVGMPQTFVEPEDL